jgi:hypothetical protein
MASVDLMDRGAVGVDLAVWTTIQILSAGRSK